MSATTTDQTRNEHPNGEEKPAQARVLGGTLSVTNRVGMTIALNVASVADAHDKMRVLGAEGWTSGEVPNGGYVLPYCMADTFDFSFIGARAFTNSAGEKCLEHSGQVYKIRAYEEETKGEKKAAKIKYSRGARPFDPPEIQEGEKPPKYVTLISFVGGGRAIKALEKRVSSGS